jgi:hypothetical protein
MEDPLQTRPLRCRIARPMKVKWGCVGGRVVGSCWWARVTDVAKRRRQGLVVCRAALPFEGLFDARPFVALAPTSSAGFLAWVACQSRTVLL